jgi:hypothetical protein
MKTKHTNPSQSIRILKHLKSGKSLTALEALTRYGCFRLAARVHELKRKGYRITQTTKHNRKTGKKFASYAI